MTFKEWGEEEKQQGLTTAEEMYGDWRVEHERFQERLQDMHRTACNRARLQRKLREKAEARVRELEEGLRKLAGDGEDEWWAQEIHRLLEKK